MDIRTLPRHARTGLLAVGWRKPRPGEDAPQPIWPVLGSAEDDDAGDGDGDGQDGDDGDGQGDDDGSDDSGDGDPEGADQLGDAGKRALDAQKAKWRAERDRRKQLEAELAAERSKATGGDGTDPDQIRAEADRAATARANARIVRSEVRAAAAGKLADPRDALRFIDLDQFEVDDDGRVDEDEVADAIDDLLKNKPYLAAQGGRRFQGRGDGGARTGSSALVQVTEAELDKMTPEQIERARVEGRLDDLLGVKR